jgi:ricin-type beta-trefoil lectin protein
VILRFGRFSARRAAPSRGRALALAGGTVAVAMLGSIGLAQVASAGSVTPGGGQVFLTTTPTYPEPPTPGPSFPPDPPTSPPASGGGGGGGGGGSGSPGNPVPADPRRAERVAIANRAWELARQLIRDNPTCAQFLEGTLSGGSPPPGRDAISMIDGAHIVVVHRLGVTRSAATRAWSGLGQNDPGEPIRLYQEVFDPREIPQWYQSAVDAGIISQPSDLGPGLSAEEYAALVILHELGHQTGTNQHDERRSSDEDWLRQMQYEVNLVDFCIRSGGLESAQQPWTGPPGTTATGSVSRRSALRSAWDCARECTAFPVDTRLWPTYHAPAVVTSPAGRSDAFTIGDDMAVWHSYQATPGGEWSSWRNIGAYPASGAAGGQPVAALNANGTAVVFVFGANWDIYYNQQQTPGGSFTGWQRFPGGNWGYNTFTVARNADGRLEAFVQSNTDFYLYHIWQTTPGGAWSGWARLTDRRFGFGPQPSAVVNAAGRIELYLNEGVRSGVYRLAQTASGTWSGSSLLGQPGGFGTMGRVFPISHPDGRIHLFAYLDLDVTSNDAIYHAWQTSPGGNFTGWSRLGNTGTATGGLQAVTVDPEGQLEVYGYDGLLVTNIRECAGCPNAGWSDWSGLIPRGTPEVAPVLDGVRYTLTTRNSGRCLSVTAASTAHAATANQWDCIGALNQVWQAEQLPGGAYQLIAVHSGLCLDVLFGLTTDGAQVGQAICSSNPAQRWRLLPAENGRYQVIAEHSGMCLAVAHNRLGNGEAVVQENCDYPQLDERWLFTPVG